MEGGPQPAVLIWWCGVPQLERLLEYLSYEVFARVGLIRLRWVEVTMDYREVAQWAG